ncbi:hypothetical protein [Sphingobium sp. RAC03]|uniref:hypothetical protein n=1 Tax=Sphingobium sp. RAC03 TaxID=1843368 RepID=UPI00083CAB67|nr:hypothetical protein [Sphingobium sp. RAC03]AOF97992.1 hypothetical protein BSY17_2648 [Sphingobium sp. RAC03]
MKIVNLAVPAILEKALRYPSEGPFTVNDKEAQRLKDNGSLDGDPEDLPEEEDQVETKTTARRGKAEA